MMGLHKTMGRVAALAAMASISGLGLVATPPPVARAAEEWSRTFASETTRTVFLASDGSVFRARFDLTDRAVLWQPRGSEHVARLRVSPDGARAAWTTRSEEQDSTRLWVVEDSVPRRVAFVAVRPVDYGITRYEQEGPSLRDATVHGARLVRPGPFANRPSTNVLEWTPDGRRPIVADTLGLMVVDLARSALTRVAPGLATRLRALDPAPMYLASFVARAARGAAGEASVLIYPAADRWPMFTHDSFDFGDAWAASEGAVWWAHGKRAYEVRASDPRRRLLADAPTPIAWIGYDRLRRQVLWTSGRELHAGPDEGGPDTILITLPDRIRNAHATADGQVVALMVGKTAAHVWDLAAREAREVPLGSVPLDTLLRAPGGALVFGSRGGHSARAELQLLEPGARALHPLAGPRPESAEIATTPSGRFILLYTPRTTAPATLHAFDTVEGRWIEVGNPGLTAWEPLLPAP